MSSLPSSTKCYQVSEKPTAAITKDTFTLETRKLETPVGSQILVKVLYLSNDPAQRTWIQAGADQSRAYITLPNVGDIMPARALCKVLAAGPDAKFKVDDTVVGTTGWTQYLVVKSEDFQQAIQIPGQSQTIALGALGSTGLTAYYGLLKVGKATSSDQCIVVSGAAGATGSMVVQIAKHILKIPKVIGLASKEKCSFVTDIGADECIDYKSETWKDDLRKATGAQADLYYDNVGGQILDEMLSLLRRHGRVVACGAISSYNNLEGGTMLKNYFEVITNRLSILGFIVIDAIPQAQEYIKELAGWIMEGKIKVVEGKSETIKASTIEDVPKTWGLLFNGGSSGKLVTQLQD